jgi:hypothetical protein
MSAAPLEIVTPTGAMRRITLFCGLNEDEAYFMERTTDASAYEVVLADDAELWNDRMSPKPGPWMAQQVACDHLKGVSDSCLESGSAYIWVKSETSSAAAVFIAARLAADLLSRARPVCLWLFRFAFSL